MIAVIFEVFPAEGQQDRYLDIAEDLRQDLSQVRGFLAVERFQSLTMPGKLLSLSFFEDEAAVQRWRRLRHHRAAQSEGRDGVFSDYRLRVAHVLRDYGLDDRQEAPKDSLECHAQTGVARNGSAFDRDTENRDCSAQQGQTPVKDPRGPHSMAGRDKGLDAIIDREGP